MSGSGDGRSQRERMLAGELYIADDPQLRAMALRSRQLEERFNRSTAEDGEGRRAILEELLGEIGADTDIRPPLYCDYGSHIRIGARVFANCGLVALDVAPITMGGDVQIGPNGQLLRPSHPLDAEPRGASPPPPPPRPQVGAARADSHRGHCMARPWGHRSPWRHGRGERGRRR